MFHNRTASHDIARLGMRNAVSLHRDSESAEKITFPTGKIFFSNWEAEFKPKFVKPDSKPCNESFESLTGKSSEKDKTEREPSRKGGNPF